ncbi:MAG: PrsW family intramembrane metalloprotease [Firmicutes bacterium]|nr:PrsW family intramembrane metalloprotease [Bacillota bacterium]
MLRPLASFYGGNIILIVAAIVPAFFLLRFIYRHDRLERESFTMIRNLVLMGIVSTFIAVMCERLGLMILNAVFREPNVLYNLILYFPIVGLSEEASKYVVLKRATWNSPEFNCKFDGVVYAVTVSLGFALWENIEYVLMYGLTTAMVRAVTAVPGHACFGVFMGVWYGLAKRCELRGDEATGRTCRRLAVLMPAVIHGCYDFIATLTNAYATIIFVVFVAAMFLVCYVMVKRLSANDEYL